MQIDAEVGNASEVGRHIARLRDAAGLKQADLAKKVTLSPAVLSRIESGERPLAEEEASMILAAIGTAESDMLRRAIEREWKVVGRPPIDHPDQDLLWQAELTARKLEDLRQAPDLRSAFESRLRAYVEEILQTSMLLLKREHQLAFIGSIGIGKSTAICRLTGLEIVEKDGEVPSPVLEAGAGGITICEVHLRTGPAYGLMIEPRSEEEVRADVADFAEFLLGSDESRIPDEEGEANGETQGIAREIERAIRNMSGLKIRRERQKGGKTVRHDLAKELARGLNLRELIVEILTRMELHKRDKRDLWYEHNSGKTELEWLKETFEKINNGRHPSFTLPKRIEVIIPRSLIGESDLNIRMIDTRGIDRTAARADLEGHLDDPHTIAVLCSPFNNAGSGDPRVLLERAMEAGVRTLDSNSALMVLPRPNEALAVKDESGIRVENVEEGYELKQEQVLMSLQPLKLGDYPIAFFNAYQDDPNGIREFLNDRVAHVRQRFRKHLSEVIENAELLLENQEQEQVQEVIRHAATMLRTWADQNSKPKPLNLHLQESLMAELSKAYASTIRAAVRREGEWTNLSYSHHLGYGARRLAASTLGPCVDGFSQLCSTMAANPEYAEASELIGQADRVLVSSCEDMLRKVQLMGQTSFRDALKVDSAFWSACDSEWGKGAGYRDRVKERNTTWFESKERKDLELELWKLIEREWASALANLKALFEQEQNNLSPE